MCHQKVNSIMEHSVKPIKLEKCSNISMKHWKIKVYKCLVFTFRSAGSSWACWQKRYPPNLRKHITLTSQSPVPGCKIVVGILREVFGEKARFLIHSANLLRIAERRATNIFAGILWDVRWYFILNISCILGVTC